MLDLLIHPAVAITVVLLVITAYLLKNRKRQYFRGHYAAGIFAFTLTMVAFPLGLETVLVSPSVRFPFTLNPHVAIFLFAVLLIMIQGGLGMSMLLFGRRRWMYAVHRRVARYVLVVFMLQGALGLTVLIGILGYV